MKKLLVTLDINNYNKEITKLTFPYMKQYAKNIGADFHIITKRKFPDLDISLEKFQLYDVCSNYDWVIFLDADCLINPETVDFTKLISEDRVLISKYISPEHHFYPKNIEEKYNLQYYAPFFFLVFHKYSKKCVKPYKNPLDYCKYINIKSQNEEFLKYLSSKITSDNIVSPSWFLDEFLLTLNMHKYEIKTASLKEDFPKPNIMYHASYSLDNKIKFLSNSIKKMKTINSMSYL